MERVEVWRGKHGDPVPLFGPLPGLRDGDVVAYEWELPTEFVPWPGRTQLERTYVLLDIGVSLCNPLWREARMPDGRLIAGIGSEHGDTACWYVDLIHVTESDGGYIFRDLYVDVIVPGDDRHHRILDLDEFADAMGGGTLELADAIDGLKRWQLFLDLHLHGDREAGTTWTDFPPAALKNLASVPPPIGEIVRFEM